MLLQEFGNALCTGTVYEELKSIDFKKGQELRIADECHRIKKVWSDLLFSQAMDNSIKRYIWFQQHRLLDLADTLYNRIKQDKQSVSPTDNETTLISISFLLEQLLELNQFLVHYFYSYINQEVKIPEAATPKARKEICQAAERLNASLPSIEFDGQLKACILNYLQDITTADEGLPITYRSCEYMMQFIKSLSATTAIKDSRDSTHNVMEALFYLNFNHSSFCRWYQEDLIKKKILLKPSDQLPMLKRQLLVLKTMPVILTISYNSDLVPVNVLLENWLNEYIKEEHIHPDLWEMDMSQKIELKLTVAQLALLIRLLYEEGVFATKNIASLLRFFSRHFMSKKQEHISYGSMNKLYYSGDQFTGYAVRELLLKMVAKINKMFFPM